MGIDGVKIREKGRREHRLWPSTAAGPGAWLRLDLRVYFYPCSVYYLVKYQYPC